MFKEAATLESTVLHLLYRDLVHTPFIFQEGYLHLGHSVDSNVHVGQSIADMQNCTASPCKEFL